MGNGECSDGSCKCVPEWTGETCGELNLHPARPSPQAGYDELGVSSWGGSIVADETGLYHMFVSRMEDGAGLSNWTKKSEIIHATSADAEGPYTYNQTILKAFAHGPTIRSLGVGKGYLLMHLGCGYAINAPGKELCTQTNVSIRTSPSVWGPWSHSQQVFLSSGSTDPSWHRFGFTNPAPWVLADGSIALAFRAISQADDDEHVSVAFADTPLGPYVDNRMQPIVSEWSEDPFLWQDERGHWHMLVHTKGKDSPQGFEDAAHLFSRDKSGPWTLSTVAPYTQKVQFADGTSKLLWTRQRPQLLLSPVGQPRFFSSAVQVDGKPDRTYTLVVRVKSEQNSVFV